MTRFTRPRPASTSSMTRPPTSLRRAPASWRLEQAHAAIVAHRRADVAVAARHSRPLEDGVDQLALPLALDELVLDQVALAAHPDPFENAGRGRVARPQDGRSRGAGRDRRRHLLEQRPGRLGGESLPLVVGVDDEADLALAVIAAAQAEMLQSPISSPLSLRMRATLTQSSSSASEAATRLVPRATGAPRPDYAAPSTASGRRPAATGLPMQGVEVVLLAATDARSAAPSRAILGRAASA